MGRRKKEEISTEITEETESYYNESYDEQLEIDAEVEETLRALAQEYMVKVEEEYIRRVECETKDCIKESFFIRGRRKAKIPRFHTFEAPIEYDIECITKLLDN